MTIRLIILDDHPLVRKSIRTLLADSPDVEIVGEGGVGEELEVLVKAHEPDVVLLDLTMPQNANETILSGGKAYRAAGAISRITRMSPNIRILVVSQVLDRITIEGVAEAGISGKEPCMAITVRDYRVSDFPTVIGLFQKDFPEEELFETDLTLEEYCRWLRITQGGAFGLLRLLARLSRVGEMVLVAEVDGKVVGTLTFIGQGHVVEASAALVDPAYRQRGGASTLGEEVRHHLVAHKDCKYVRSTVIQTNTASLALNQHFGLEVYDGYTEYDLPLPLADDHHSPVAGITSRPRRSADQSALEELVRRTLPAVFEIDGVEPMNILVGRVYNYLIGTKRLERVYEQHGRVVGLMRAWADRKSVKGLMAHPKAASIARGSWI